MTTHRERIQAALTGQPVDRVPVCCWQHFAYADGDAQAQIASLTDYQARYDWDMVKLMFRSDFLGKDWGVVADEYEPTLGYLLRRELAIQQADDWTKIKPLDPHQGVLAEMLEVTTAVRERCGGDIYLLATAFTPMMVASQLAGMPQTLADIDAHPEAVHAALEAITETLIAFVKACMAAGADALFFADETAGLERLSREQYAVFGHPYNRRFLEGIAGETDFLMLHVCNHDVYLDEFYDYPVQAINWDHTLGNPSLAEARQHTDICLVGGMDKVGPLWKGTPDDVRAEARAAVAEAGDKKFILAPGCGIPFESPEANLRAMREVCEEL